MTANMDSIERVYGKIDKIRNLKSGENHQKYELMNKTQILELAKYIVNQIQYSKYKTVVVSESGATPIIKICAKIAKDRNLKINWFLFKTPSQTKINLYEMIKFYLSAEELEEKIEINQKIEKRKIFLKEICENIKIEKYLETESTKLEEIIKKINKPIETIHLDKILKGTQLYEAFSNDFLFFDEYIYTGTILRNFNFYAKLICKNANFKIGAYAIFVDNINNFKQIQFSLYSKSTIMEGYTKGVYPYEDRIDKIGYFYHITEKEYTKLYVKDFLYEDKAKEKKLEQFIHKIYEFIDEKNLLNKIKEKCKKEDLKEYFEKEDIIRYILKVFEYKSYKETKTNIFVEEAFDVYAPIWLPLPKEYHYEYWKSFMRVEGIIDQFVEVNQKKYMDIHRCLIGKIALQFIEK